TMGEIVQAVKRVTDIMGEISAASAEQSSGIEQVNKAVAQMDEVTQQNAALVEQAAAAAGSLEDQATRLQTSVASFRLAQADAFAGSRIEAARPKVIAAARPARTEPSTHVVRQEDTEAAEPALVDKGGREGGREASTPVLARTARPAALATSDNGDWSAF
ncbi:methyl-accepting chemotaxis protein, partial [Cupriavidus sp. SK-3]|uniref:methyl-accepting chemotaxis protein n=2 Tax=unclassified Cupriavidus TaxID=2640874 RepID=UPI00055E02F3